MAADSTCQPWVCSDAYALDESKSPSNSAISGLGNYTFLPGKSSMKRTNVYASSLSARLRGFLNALENLPLRPRPPRQNATHCKRSIAEALLEFGRQLCNAVSDAYHSRRSSSAEYRQAADGGRLDCSGQTSNQSVCWARSGRSGISAKIRLWRSLFAASICLDIRSNERSQQPRPNRSLVVSAVAIWRAAGVAPAVLRVAWREASKSEGFSRCSSTFSTTTLL
jgi:hypothetical protein